MQNIRRALSRALPALLALGAAALLALCLQPARAHADDGTYGFPDVFAGDWYANDEVLGYALEHGLVRGYDNGCFGPYDDVLRGQVAVVLHRMSGEPAADAPAFEDVDYSEYYGSAIAWARSTGVINGYKDADGEYRTFRPDAPVTREELAAMLANYAGRIGNVVLDADHSKLGAMPDAASVSDWARASVAWAMDAGLMSGDMTSGTALVNPQGGAWRSAMAKMAGVLHRDVLPPVIDPGHENVVEYRPGVVVAEGASYAISTDGSVSADAASLPVGAKAGDVVALMPTADNPEGSAVRLDSVAGGRATGSPVALAEVYQTLDVEGVSDPSAVSIVPADGVEMVQDGRSRASVDFGTYEFKFKGVSFKISPSSEFKVDFGWGRVKEVYLACTLAEEVSGKLSVGDEFEHKLCDVSFPTSVPGMFFKMAVWANVSVEGKVQLSVANETTVGVRYKSEKFVPIAKNKLDVSLELEASAKAGVDATISLDALCKPLVDASLGTGAKFEANGLTARPSGLVCCDATSSVYADLGIGQHDSMLADLDISWSKGILDKDLGTAHFENGKAVGRCTWKDGFPDAPNVPEPDPDPTPDPGNPDEPGSLIPATPESDFKYSVLDGSEGYEIGEYVSDVGFYVGPGTYVLQYIGQSDMVGIPHSICESSVVSVDLTWSDKPIKALDMTRCTELRSLRCNGSRISSLDLSGCTELELLECGYNALRSLDVSECGKIIWLECQEQWDSGVPGEGGRCLDQLNIAGCRYLEHLNCGQTEISSLDLSDCAYLRFLNVFNCTKMSTVDVSANGKLEELYCGACFGVRFLDVSKNPKLEILSCSDNALTKLDIRSNPKLSQLDCSENALLELDISYNSKLRYLNCSQNRIANTSALEAWLSQPGHSGQVKPQVL